MATTHIHHTTPSQRAYERREERSSYAAVWAILALAVVAAVAYGYYGAEEDSIDNLPMSSVQSTTSPATDGSTSSMVGTGAASNELTPSVVTPGSPDTTTTESSNVPADGIN